MLEVYANNLNESNSNDKLLNLIRNYEMEIKPNLSDTTASDEILTSIMNENNNLLKEDVSDEVVDNVNGLLGECKALIESTLEDKKLFKKFSDLIENYQEFVLSKRSTPLVTLSNEKVNLLEQYQNSVKPNVLNKTLFGEETGYLDKDAAEKLLKIIKEYEKEVKPNIPNSEEIDTVLYDLLEAESKVTTANTINYEVSSGILELLEKYENSIKENVTSEKVLEKILENIEDYRNYISSKTTSNTNENVFNMLEVYANNLNESNSNDKLLNLIRNYELEIKPNLSDTTASDEILTSIVTENNNLLKEDVSDEVVDNVNGLLDECKTLIESTLEDKKLFKKFSDLVENYQEFVLSKRSTPLVTDEAIISKEEKEEILSLLDQYQKYIKPYILTKTLFGKENGYIDKKYANNIFDLINDYERNIKDNLSDNTATNDLLNKIIDFSSTTDFKNITLEQIEKCEGLINEFKTKINDSTSDEKALAKINGTINEISEYLNSLKPVKEETAISDNAIMPVVIPSKKKEKIVPVVIPSKKKSSKVDETTEDNKESSNVDEIIDVIKENDTVLIEKPTKKIKKSKVSTVKEDTDNVEEILDIIKGKAEEPTILEKPVEIKSSKKNNKKKRDKVEPEVQKIEEVKNITEAKGTTDFNDNIVELIEEKPVEIKSLKKKKEKSADDVPIIISSKTNRNKKKKQNKIEKEIKKLEKIEKAFEQDLKNITESKETADFNDNIVELTEEKPVEIKSSKKNNKKKQDKVELEVKKIEEPIEEVKNITESNDMVEDYDLEYDMIEANEDDYSE